MEGKWRKGKGQWKGMGGDESGDERKRRQIREGKGKRTREGRTIGVCRFRFPLHRYTPTPSRRGVTQ